MRDVSAFICGICAAFRAGWFGWAVEQKAVCVCVFASGSFHPLRFMGAFATLRVASLGIYSPCFFDRSNNPTVKKEPSPLNSPVPRNEL